MMIWSLSGRIYRRANGDIVIALLEDEATCKTLNITPDGVWLMPENPAYPPINGTGCQILGVVKAVYREY